MAEFAARVPLADDPYADHFRRCGSSFRKIDHVPTGGVVVRNHVSLGSRRLSLPSKATT